MAGTGANMDLHTTRKKLEQDYAVAQLRLAREKDKPSPDMLKIDRHERELAKLQAMHAELERRKALMNEFGNIMKNELEIFESLLANGQKISRSELSGKIKFQDRLWEDLFVDYVKQQGKVKIGKKFGFFGDEMFEKA